MLWELLHQPSRCVSQRRISIESSTPHEKIFALLYLTCIFFCGFLIPFCLFMTNTDDFKPVECKVIFESDEKYNRYNKWSYFVNNTEYTLINRCNDGIHSCKPIGTISTCYYSESNPNSARYDKYSSTKQSEYGGSIMMVIFTLIWLLCAVYVYIRYRCSKLTNTSSNQDIVQVVIN